MCQNHSVIIYLQVSSTVGLLLNRVLVAGLPLSLRFLDVVSCPDLSSGYKRFPLPLPVLDSNVNSGILICLRPLDSRRVKIPVLAAKTRLLTGNRMKLYQI